MIGLSTEDRRDLVRWIICGVIVVLVHAGVAAAMMRWHDLAEAADPASAIVIELAALPVAPAAEPTDLPVGPEQDQADAQPEEKVVEKPEEEKVVEKPAEQVVDKPVEQVVENAAEKAQEKVEEKQEEQVAETEEKVVEQETKVVATLAVAPEVPVSPPRPETKPVPQKNPVEPPKPQAKPQPKSRPQVVRPPAPATTRPQPAPGRQAALPAAPRVGTPSPVNSNALPNWKSQVMGILQRNKRYPPDAQARHEQGVAQLAFSVDRSGRVVSSRLVGSSGSSALDAETLALVRRSSPFPPPPPGVGGAQISLTIPIRYGIR